jgi:hypothetical protein
MSFAGNLITVLVVKFRLGQLQFVELKGVKVKK